MESYEKTLKRIQRIMREENLVMSTAGPRELFINVDGTLEMSSVFCRLKLLHEKLIPVVSVHRRLSKGGNGWHVRVVLSENISSTERVALHSIVGSDVVRELLRLKAIRRQTDDQDSIFLDRADYAWVEVGNWTASCPGGVL